MIKDHLEQIRNPLIIPYVVCKDERYLQSYKTVRKEINNYIFLQVFVVSSQMRKTSAFRIFISFFYQINLINRKIF